MIDLSKEKSKIDNEGFIAHIPEYIFLINIKIGKFYYQMINNNEKIDENVEEDHDFKDFSHKDIQEYAEAVRTLILYIIEHNKKIIKYLESQIVEESDYKEGISKLDILQESEITPIRPSKTNDSNDEIKNNDSSNEEISNLINKIIESDIELEILIKLVKPENITAIKILLIAQKKKIIKEIRDNLATDITMGISNLQDQVLRIDYFLLMLNDEEEIIQEQENENENIKIIILPNDAHTTYLLEDIKNYENRYDIIANALKKLRTKILFKTSGIRRIISVDKLYEYRETNGLRILFYVQSDNVFVITSLFFKDQRRSTKIDGFYEQAQKRLLQDFDETKCDEYLANQEYYFQEIQAELSKNQNVLKKRSQN